MGVVTCGGCGISFNRANEGAEFIKGKWYHANCALIKNQKIELDAYVCKIFGLKAPGPVNNKLLQKYKIERGYSYDGMLNALKFWYEVKGHTANKAQERVGIIPYIYAEAQEYYSRIEKKQERIANSPRVENQHIKVSFEKDENIIDKKEQEIAQMQKELDELFGEG